MKRLSRFWSSLILLLIAPAPVFAQGIFGEAGDRLKKIANPSIGVNEGPVAGLVGNIINTAISILGLIAFGLILYAGGLWLTAAGNDDKIEEAKKIIKSVVVGVIIVGLAYAITAFIITLVVKQ